jgi:hypothetical protein
MVVTTLSSELRVKSPILLGVFLYLSSATPVVLAQEQLLIRRVQDTPLASLDSAAPGVTVSQWLAQLGGVPPTALTWEVNDCGEGGDGREAPGCVEGKVSLGEERSASISVVVVSRNGTTEGGPAIFMMYVRDGSEVTFADSIRELEMLVEKSRE